MLNKIKSLSFFILLFTSCSSERPEIRALCETNDIGDYIIKWETFPTLDGTVKIYEISPDSLKPSKFITEQNTKDGITTIFGNQTNNRRYFELIFPKAYSFHVAERHLKTDKIYNLRDIGGYYTNNRKQIKWGKIYRSSSIASASKKDIEKLNSLGIKTVIDCRTNTEIKKFPVKFKCENTIQIPLRGIDTDFFKEKIKLEEMKRGDVLIMLQDLYVDILEKNTDYFCDLFNILLNENNYPILMHCSLGKDRVGLTTALILSALEVNREQISQDYMLSNNFIDHNSIVANASNLPYDVQEALTALLGSNERTLEYALGKIIKDYGSIINYLEDEVELSNKKRENLKDLLLY